MAPENIPQGTVLALADGKATVSVDTGGCNSCGHGSACGIGKLASQRAHPRLVLDAPAGVRVGDRVSLALPEKGLTSMATLGYLFPAFAMLMGAALGHGLMGSDAATALGAILGFLGALALVSLLVRQLPGLMPPPKIIAAPRFIPIVPSPFTYTEPHHER